MRSIRLTSLFVLLACALAVGLNVCGASAQDATPNAPATQPAPVVQSAPAVQATPSPQSQTLPGPAAPVVAVTDSTYLLGTDDKIRVIVYDQTDLSGEFVIDNSGFVRFPLVGQLQAAGLTVHQLEDEIINKLKDGYLNDPRVNVEVETYRPFYIIGEVNKPGEYAYVSGMSVLNAVALAGGYTYRANDSEVFIRRNGSNKEEKLPADQLTKIRPGDIVRIDERFF